MMLSLHSLYNTSSVYYTNPLYRILLMACPPAPYYYRDLVRGKYSVTLPSQVRLVYAGASKSVASQTDGITV